jgi:16S rRNA processing protein RimM
MVPPQADTVPVARIVGTFGLRGELKCDATSAGRGLIVPGAAFRCVRNGEAETVRIASARPHKGRLLVSLEGSEDAGAAERYVGGTLEAQRGEIPLSEGEYLDVDLIGCAVNGLDGRSYGTVLRVEHFPASDMLVVDRGMVPMVAAIVKSVDPARRQIVIDPPAGLLD